MLLSIMSQMRDIPGFIETRKKILDGKPNLKASWVAYAVANFVGGNYKDAFETIKKFGESNYKKNPDEVYEESELLLFQNRCLEQEGLYAEAIAHLHSHKAAIVDKLSWNVKHAELLLLSGQFAEAKAEWRTLVSEQPDNYRFHTGFQAAHLELSPADSTAAFALKRLELPSTEFSLSVAQLTILRAAYDEGGFRSKSLSKIRLTLLSDCDADFQAALSGYIKKCLKDGMPALHHDVCSLFRIADPFNGGRRVFAKDAHDVVAHPVFVFTSQLVATYIANLRQFKAFEPIADGSPELAELPSALLWALYLQCHLLELSGRYAEALAVIEECIQHTPTAIDMYSKKARLLKKQGDLAGAAATMDECRALDLQDRYLNNKTTKYFLRADQMEQGMATIAMFTKHDGDPQKILYDLQCNWYELEAGESFARTKQWGPALKKFHAVKKHFGDHYDDMFDFHGYCIRKVSLAHSRGGLFQADFFCRPRSVPTKTSSRCRTTPTPTSSTCGQREERCASTRTCWTAPRTWTAWATSAPRTARRSAPAPRNRSRRSKRPRRTRRRRRRRRSGGTAANPRRRRARRKRTRTRSAKRCSPRTFWPRPGRGARSSPIASSFATARLWPWSRTS